MSDGGWGHYNGKRASTEDVEEAWKRRSKSVKRREQRKAREKRGATTDGDQS